jgi:coproporphyrinogen III oxidase-like Fe-S oxidoreductase
VQSGIDIAPRGDPSNTWQIVCLVEIANFSALRRKFGRVGADSLALAQVEQCRRNTQGTRAGKYLILLGVGLGAKPDVLTTFCL